MIFSSLIESVGKAFRQNRDAASSNVPQNGQWGKINESAMRIRLENIQNRLHSLEDTEYSECEDLETRKLK